MDERYRLVCRGDVQDGQHRAGVKKRLGQLLKIDGEKLEALFTGDGVVIRRETDAATAAKVEAAFKQAGARLRVVPLTTAESSSAEPTQPVTAAQGPRPSGWSLRPMSGDLIDDDEREAPTPVVVDVSHLTVAAPGADLGPHGATAEPAVDVDSIHFDVAPVGSDLGQKPREAAPPGPDTSHLRLT